MLELEPLGPRLLPSGLSHLPLPSPNGLPLHYSPLERALDAYELLTHNTSLRESLDSLAGQVVGVHEALNGLLHPLTGAIMQSMLGDYSSPARSVLVNPTTATPAGGEPVFYVNGIDTTRAEAVTDAQGLANQLDRPVQLLYNPTHGLVRDIVRVIGDLLWSPPLPQPDHTARELTDVLLSAQQQNQTVDIVAYSGGTVATNDALRTMDALGLGPWTYSHVALICVAAPLGPFQADGTAHFQRIDNIGDPVAEFLGDRRDSLLAKLDPVTYDLPVSLDQHSFLSSYVSQITTTVLF